MSSPCQRCGVSPSGKSFPCLDKGWDDRPCPMNAASAEWLREYEALMYKLGYSHAAWIVRRRWFGLFQECTLHFSKVQPTRQAVAEALDGSVLHVSPAGSLSTG